MIGFEQVADNDHCTDPGAAAQTFEKSLDRRRGSAKSLAKLCRWVNCRRSSTLGGSTWPCVSAIHGGVPNVGDGIKFNRSQQTTTHD